MALGRRGGPEWAPVHPRAGSTAKQMDDFLHELDRKCTGELCFGEDYAGGPAFKPARFGRRAVQVMCDALVRSVLVEDPVVRLQCVAGVLRVYADFCATFGRQLIRRDCEMFFGEECSDSDSGGAGPSKFCTIEDYVKPPGADVAGACWGALQGAVSAFGACVAGRKDNDIVKFRQAKKAAGDFAAIVQEHIDSEGTCVLICSSQSGTRRLTKKSRGAEKLVAAGASLQAELTRFFEATGRDEDFERGGVTPIFQDSRSGDADKFVEGLTPKDALKYARGKFQQRLERACDRGGGTFSNIRGPIYGEYVAASCACEGVKNPLAVLAIHHGIFLGMENWRLLPPCDWEEDVHGVCGTLQKALDEYAAQLRGTTAALPRYVGEFLKALLVDQMIDGGAYKYVPCAMSAEGSIEGVDLKKQAMGFLAETELQASGGALVRGGTAGAEDIDVGGCSDRRPKRRKKA